MTTELGKELRDVHVRDDLQIATISRISAGHLPDTSVFVAEAEIPDAPDNVHYIAAFNGDTCHPMGAVRIEEIDAHRASIAVFAGPALLESEAAGLIALAIEESKAPQVEVDPSRTNVPSEVLQKAGFHALANGAEVFVAFQAAA